MDSTGSDLLSQSSTPPVMELTPPVIPMTVTARDVRQRADLTSFDVPNIRKIIEAVQRKALPDTACVVDDQIVDKYVDKAFASGWNTNMPLSNTSKKPTTKTLDQTAIRVGFWK
ncbi:hypothetical protein JX266_006034 [Neoarthrinium moseri]|nr:hypothetical protein JX266_006034 [Neoarthrinium moseri]